MSDDERTTGERAIDAFQTAVLECVQGEPRNELLEALRLAKRAFEVGHPNDARLVINDAIAKFERRKSRR